MNHPSTELKNQEEVPRIIRKQKALVESFAFRFECNKKLKSYYFEY